MFARGSDVVQGLADMTADFRHLEGGRDKTSHLSRRALPRSGSSDGQGCKKGAIGRMLGPYHASRDCRVR